MCLPEIEKVTDVSASISLQKLLDCTTERILKLKTETEIDALDNTNLILISKWGCDGTLLKSKRVQTEN